MKRGRTGERRETGTGDPQVGNARTAKNIARTNAHTIEREEIADRMLAGLPPRRGCWDTAPRGYPRRAEAKLSKIEQVVKMSSWGSFAVGDSAIIPASKVPLVWRVGLHLGRRSNVEKGREGYCTASKGSPILNVQFTCFLLS